MEEKKEPMIYYKIMANKKYRVFKNTYNDRDYYRIQVKQKNYDGQEDIYYINVQFKRNIELPNESDIIIKEAYENIRPNKLDKFNGIHYLVITEFEKVENEEQLQAQAYKDFRDNLDQNENMDIDASQLPF